MYGALPTTRILHKRTEVVVSVWAGGANGRNKVTRTADNCPVVNKLTLHRRSVFVSVNFIARMSAAASLAYCVVTTKLGKYNPVSYTHLDVYKRQS